ncbi:hypothetical protein [Pendulispora albinea]|uniref:Flp pilus-assembly TadG-like N-terminal domain-containing protein n=1 Tax=Pendulispora albinea TaxID=2741071 RepID=A0ABZ2MBT8_9BACT
MDSGKKDLVGDDKGAIMIMGLFMSISLIGALWFILGIANAIIIRDTAMEAADHAVFSAATVHARGMNYISALNLIMFALTIVYVLFCLIADTLIAIAAVMLWGKVPFLGCIGVPGPNAVIGAPACRIGHTIADVGSKYAGGIDPVMKALGALETVIQMGFPAVAEVSSFTIAEKYKIEANTVALKGVLITPALIPVKSINQSDKPIGLPVYAEKNDYLCDRSFNVVKDLVYTYIPAPISSIIGQVLNLIKGYIGFLPVKRSVWDPRSLMGIGCDGKPFNRKDIHLVSQDAKVKNGSDYFQMWSLIINAKDNENGRYEQRVSMSKNKGKSTESQPPKKRIYYAQAEYYFDCTKDWKNKECYDKELREASFNMNWRARLRRVRAPSFGNNFLGQATSFLMAGNIQNYVAGQFGNSAAGQKMAGALDKLMNGSVSAVLTGTDVGNGINDLNNFATGGDRPIH